MLYVNNVELKPALPEWKKYQDFLDNILPTLQNIVIFKKNKPIVINPTGLKEADTRKFIPFEARVYDETYGSQHWRYCETAPVKNESGKWKYSPLGEEFKRLWTIDKTKQPDKIFFMLELSHDVKNNTIICEDREKEALKTIEKDDKAVAVKFMVTNAISPLSPESTGSEELLRMIAAAWGVSQAHQKRKSLPEIRVELFGIIESNEKKHDVSGRGFDTFLMEIKSRERIVLRANIQRAIDNKIIKYDKNNFTWKYVTNDQVISILSTRFFNNPDNGLFDYFLRDDDKRRIFYGTLDERYEESPSMDEHVEEEEVLDEAEEEVIIPKVDEPLMDKPSIPPVFEKPPPKPAVSSIEDMKWNDLQKKAKEMGLQAFGVSRERLIEDIRGKIAVDKEMQKV